MSANTRVYVGVANVGVLPKTKVVNHAETLIFPVPSVHLLIVLVLALLSAISLLYVKDLNRRLFIDYQKMQTSYTQLQTEHEKLLLEQSAWSTSMRVQQIAEQRLNMQMPNANTVVIVKV